MKKLGLIAAMMLFPLSVSAQQVEVEWLEPDSYRDIEAAQEGKERFRTRLFEALESNFQALGERHLQEGTTLKLKVTDLDLAGQVMLEEVGTEMRTVRRVRDSEYPRISFSYELTDESGSVMKSGEERLTGTLPGQGRLHRASRREGTDLVQHETAMMERWFRNTFKEE